MTTPSARALLLLPIALFACRDEGASHPSLDAAAASDASADAPSGGSFNGAWNVVSFNGGPSEPATWTFGATDVTVVQAGSTFSGTYTVDASATPKSIDIAITGATPNPNLAIYRFDSPTHLVLKLQDNAGAVRATTFDIDVDNYDLLELDRQ